MHARSRRYLALMPAAYALVIALAACTPDDGTTTGASTVSAGPTHMASAEASEASGSGVSDAPLGSQTDTEWGRIWDAVPANFPRYPGATTADDASPDPVSAAYAIAAGDAAEIASWVQTNLEMATYSTEALSGPYEDGGYVLDSVGEADCRVQVKIAPQGGLVLVTVLYGAACPA